MNIKKINLFVAFSSILLLFPMCVVNANGWVDATGEWINSSGYISSTVRDCTNCSWNIPARENESIENLQYSKIIVRNADGDNVTLTVCSSGVAERNPSACSITSDDFPKSTIGNNTNEQFQVQVDQWFTQTLSDGQLNIENCLGDDITNGCGVAKAIAQLTDNCKTGNVADCQKQFIQNLIDDKSYDTEVYPGFLMYDTNSYSYQMVDASNGAKCTDYSSVLGYRDGYEDTILCASWTACHAGYDSSTHNNIRKDDMGVCNGVLDAEDLPADACTGDCCECYEQCETENANIEQCRTCMATYCTNPNPSEPEEPAPSNPNACAPGNKVCGDECSGGEEWPDNIPGNASCGQVYKSTTYSEGVAICKGAIELIKTVTTVPLPGSPGTIYAGQGFNWGQSTTETIVTSTSVYGTMSVVAQKNAKTVELDNLNSQLECIVAKINEAKSKLEDLQGEKNNLDCDVSDEAKEYGSCMGRCMNICKAMGITNVSECKECETCGSAPSVPVRCTTINADIAAANNQISALQTQQSNVEALMSPIEVEIEELSTCLNTLSNYSKPTKTEVNKLDATNVYMKIGNHTQDGNSVVGVAKNSCNLVYNSNLQEYKNNFINNNSTFFMPCGLGNASGKVYATYVGNGSYSVTCPVNTLPGIVLDGLTIIYRPISLTNPFPNINNSSDSRLTLGFWTSLTMADFITNNRGVSDYNVYNETPMYTITLTPKLIKEIREYNKNNSFSDFNMNCTDGLYCQSEFLSLYAEKFGMNESNSCALGASKSNWYKCDSSELAQIRDEMLFLLQD